MSRYESCIYGYPERERLRLERAVENGARRRQALQRFLPHGGIAAIPAGQQAVGDVEEGHGGGFHRLKNAQTLGTTGHKAKD